MYRPPDEVYKATVRVLHRDGEGNPIAWVTDYHERLVVNSGDKVRTPAMEWWPYDFNDGDEIEVFVYRGD